MFKCSLQLNMMNTPPGFLQRLGLLKTTWNTINTFFMVIPVKEDGDYKDLNYLYITIIPDNIINQLT